MAERIEPSFVQLREKKLALARVRATEGKASGDAQWRTEVARGLTRRNENAKRMGLENDDLYAAAKAAAEHHVRFRAA